MNAFFNKIVSFDISNNYYLKRPNSGWIVVSLPVPIVVGVELLEHVKKSKSIISLTRNKTHGHHFDDNLCLFRCLALYFGASLRGLERDANRYREKLEEYTGKSLYEGVELSELGFVETYFHVAINVYSLQESGHATMLRLSRLNNFNIMHLHLYEKHFSYINKFKSFAKKYNCTICSRILNRSCNLKAHANVCYIETQEIYVGGKYNIKNNIFELLETIDINIPEEDRYDPFISVYYNEELHGRKIHFKHVPATVYMLKCPRS